MKQLLKINPQKMGDTINTDKPVTITTKTNIGLQTAIQLMLYLLVVAGLYFALKSDIAISFVKMEKVTEDVNDLKNDFKEFQKKVETEFKETSKERDDERKKR